MKSPVFGILVIGAALVLGAGRAGAQGAARASDAETILSTYHVKPGKEKAFQEVVERTWAVYRKLDAVLPSPHFLAKSTDDNGATDFHELFTWRSSDIPDNAPAEIKAVWKELQDLCEKRDGKDGIEGLELDMIRSG
jgi:hypothetical protein